MLGHPAHHRCNHRREKAADGDADQQAECELELERALRAAGEEQAEPEQHRAGQHDEARADAVAERAPAEACRPHRQKADRHGGRYRRVRPPGRFGDRPQEYREREHGADRDTGHEGAEPHHHPPVAWLCRMVVHCGFFSCGTTTIQGTPKRSATMPKLELKKVLMSGWRTSPMRRLECITLAPGGVRSKKRYGWMAIYL